MEEGPAHFHSLWLYAAGMVPVSAQVKLFLRYQSHGAEDAPQPAAGKVWILPQPVKSVLMYL